MAAACPMALETLRPRVRDFAPSRHIFAWPPPDFSPAENVLVFCSETKGGRSMIIEMRTYTLRPGSIAEAEKRFGEALPAREKHSKLAAFWHSEVGPLNQIIHVWGYDSFEHRSAVRAAASKEAGWPPNIREFVQTQQSEVFLPAPFSPPLEARQV